MPEGNCALIPARRGSKSIPNKNLTKFNGESLIRMAVKQAVDSQLFSQVVISTDYEMRELDISDITSSKFCQIMVLKRPKTHAGDNALMLDVIKHAINNTPGNYQWMWVLQPTSPFRTKADFKKVQGMLEGETRGVISLKPAKESPNRMYSFKDRKFYRTKYGNFNNKQDLKPMFERSGNFYVSKKRIFRDAKDMCDVFDSKFQGFLMGGVEIEDMYHDGRIKDPALWERSRAYGSNIDGYEDLALARYYHQKGVVKL